MKNNRNENYLDSVHRYGRIWGIIIFGLVLAMPIVVCLLFGALPEWGALFSGLLAILPMYWAVGIVEMFTYVPMLGAGGAYLFPIYILLESDPHYLQKAILDV